MPHLKNIETVLGMNRLAGNLDFLEVGKRLTSVVQERNCWLALLLPFFYVRG
jgi:hypothetical protein